MVIALVLLLGIAVLGVAAIAGKTADSRDEDFALGRVLNWADTSPTHRAS
jgi:hypothetical protein